MGHHGVFSPQIPSLPTGLFVSAKGEGCCLMQVRLQGERVLTVASGTWDPGGAGGAGGGSELSMRGRYVCLRDQDRLSAPHMQPTVPKAGPSEGDHVFPWV